MRRTVHRLTLPLADALILAYEEVEVVVGTSNRANLIVFVDVVSGLDQQLFV